jgi:lysophospholipase L1-like esterase
MFFQGKTRPLTAAATTFLTLCFCYPVNAANQNFYNYLALGDSVAFGLNPTLLTQSPPPPPSTFIGYPEAIDSLLKNYSEVNSSCPGETSGSFISGQGPDYGCYSNGPQGQPPYKATFGLHTTYSGSQLNFAVSQLTSNRHINVVTLGIGSNDVLLLIGQCSTSSNPTSCINAGLPAVLQAYAANLVHILRAIRSTAAYNGTLILVGYYSPTPSLNPIAQAINSTMRSVGGQFGVVYADGYTAFQIASAPFHGDPCAAGLVIRLTPTTCDIHPTPLGRDILAATVLASAPLVWLTH